MLHRSMWRPVARVRLGTPLPLLRCFRGKSTMSYERKTPLEHILLRPGMYIGQVEVNSAPIWTVNEERSRIVKQECAFSPGFLKIFDEIVVNAADNRHRDKKMTAIDIEVERVSTALPGGEVEKGVKVSICNNGNGIPLALHPTEKIHIPELIFGHLLTGSNFSDAEDSITGGRHGYGAKLTNIFSHSFEVEIYNASSKQLYVQKWENNMLTAHPAEITLHSGGKSDYTKVTFVPDLRKFHMSKGPDTTSILDASIALLHKRAFDIAACVHPVVTSFNSEILLPQSVGTTSSATSPGLASYIQMFLPPTPAAEGSEGASFGGESAPIDASDAVDAPMVLTTKPHPRWDIALVSPSPTQSFDQMSFVNGVCTNKGGTHVSYICDQITTAVLQEVRKRLGSAKASTGLIGPQMIRNKFMLFVNCDISNPSFDSQSKDTLTTGVDSFGSTCILSPRSIFMKSLLSSQLVDDLVAEVHLKEEMKLSKAIKTPKKSSYTKLHLEVPKLDDARFAGSSVDSKALKCKLILTEGDSAKALAVAGLEVVGREYFGVMPLRGKILNVRDASPDKLMKNEDIISLCKVIGLDFRKSYKGDLANQGLRYGSIVLMTDQDPDGSHIKGLIINLFHHFWPHLLRKEGFLQHFITPLVKVKLRGEGGKALSRARGGGATAASGGAGVRTKVFYSIPEYLSWCASIGTRQTGLPGSDGADVAESPAASSNIMSIKYYKGLGTNTAEEGKEYFRDLPMHMKLFGRGSDEQADASVDNVIDLAFRKDRVQDRKAWLRTMYDASSYIDPTHPVTSYEDFINKELIHFSHADNIRSIPSSVDGMKPAQRKVLYACFKKKLTGSAEMKVAQLAGYVAEQTAYHHGEMSLNQTIVRMAQDYVGSNNLPLLQPCGQFGTRNQGGHDHASARYIFTQLSPYARLIFPEADDCLLKYNKEDDMTVEPEMYVPVIPMVLVNGSEGIGTGWSTNIPPHDPIELIDLLVKMIKQRSGDGPKKQKALTIGRKQLVPWVRNFKGSMTPADGFVVGGNTPCKYVASGVWEVVKGKNSALVEVSELPVGVWTSNYKDFLIRAVQSGAEGGPDSLRIRGFVENHKTNSVSFQIELNRKLKKDAAAPRGINERDVKMLNALLKLQSNISLANMHAFDGNGIIQQYRTAVEVIEHFFPLRLDLYRRRREEMIKKSRFDELLTGSKARFIEDILCGSLSLTQAGDSGAVKGKGKGERVHYKSYEELVLDLRERGFLSEGQITARSVAGDADERDVADAGAGAGAGADAGPGGGYSYLLNMPIHSFTKDRVDRLQQGAADAKANLDTILNRTTPEDLWLQDLDALRKEIVKYYKCD